MLQQAMIQALRKKRLSKDQEVQFPNEAELAPGGQPSETHEGPETRDGDMQNVDKASSHGGLEHLEFPHNSKDKFVDTKVPLHEPKDNMKHEMLSGQGGGEAQKDHMGVDAHEVIRAQGSHRSVGNLANGKDMKGKVAGEVNAMMKTNQSPNMNMDNNDSDIGANEVKGRFNSPKSRLSAGAEDDSDTPDSDGVAPEGSRKPLKGLQKAKALIQKKYR